MPLQTSPAYSAGLSGGEKQRIAIARAILKNAPIIVLDEATAYADAENEAKIQEAFSRLSKGKTVIMIAHRLKTVQNADNILVMKEGRLEAAGKGGRGSLDVWQSDLVSWHCYRDGLWCVSALNG